MGTKRLGQSTSWDQFLRIFAAEFASLFERTVIDENGNERKIGYETFRNGLATLIAQPDFSVSPQAKIIIKDFADTVLNLYQMAKYTYCVIK